MKKVLYFVVAAAAVLGMASCNKTQSSSASASGESSEVSNNEVKGNDKASKEDKEFSKIYGEGLGKWMAFSISQNPKAKINTDAFVQGLETILSKDTTVADNSYLEGLAQGLQLMQEIMYYQQAGSVHFDRKVFIESLKQGIAAKGVKQEEVTKLQNEMKKYIESKMPKQMAPQGAPQVAPEQAAPAEDAKAKDADKAAKDSKKKK